MLENCYVCNSSGKDVPTTFNGVHFHCPRCGEYRITGTVAAMAKKFSEEQRARLSGWIFDQNELGGVPTVATNNLQFILRQNFPGVLERATKLLILAVKKQKRLSDRFDINDKQFLSATYSFNEGEVVELAGLLRDLGYFKFVAVGGLCQITPQGFIEAEKAAHKTTPSSQGFVAMWFDNLMHDARTNGFELGVRNAGYDPIVMNLVEHINRIDDEIIAQIRRSRFVVADFTGQRGGVYFEAGFGLGLNLPVFWTCRKDEIPNLHFDVRQFNCIDWESPSELANRLQKRIEAVIGEGPNKPNA